VQPFPNTPVVTTTTKDIEALGFQYEVQPAAKGTFAPAPPVAAWSDAELLRPLAPEVAVPWNPYSYPSVGREPGLFVGPTIPAGSPTGQSSHRKRQLGRVVSSGTSSSTPGTIPAPTVAGS
jgi:hypothetical protein